MARIPVNEFNKADLGKFDKSNNEYAVKTKLVDETNANISTTNPLEANLAGKVSDGNSTTTPLLSAQTFTGTAEDLLNYAAISILIHADVNSANDGLIVEYSPDGSDWHDGESYTIPAGITKYFTPPLQARYFRIKYTNNGLDQTEFYIHTVLHKTPVKWSSHNLNDNLNDDDDAELNLSVLKLRTAQNTYVSGAATNSGNFKVSLEEYDSAINTDPLPVHDYDLIYAQNRIFADYGDTVSVSAKLKSLLKFGKNPNVGTSTKATIWYTGKYLANEVYVAQNTNSIDTISSNNAGDTVQVVIEGHTESGGNKTFVTQTATLNGQNKVTLTTPLNRCTRVYNDDTTDLVGEVYVYEDTAITSGKPTDNTKIHLTIEAGTNQSEKASTSLSSTDYWIVTGMRGSVFRKTGTVADVEIQWRVGNKVFRMREDVTCSSDAAGVLNFKPYLIIPKNADVRLRALSSAAATTITGSIQGYLASIQ